MHSTTDTLPTPLQDDRQGIRSRVRPGDGVSPAAALPADPQAEQRRGRGRSVPVRVPDGGRHQRRGPRLARRRQRSQQPGLRRPRHLRDRPVLVHGPRRPGVHRLVRGRRERLPGIRRPPAPAPPHPRGHPEVPAGHLPVQLPGPAPGLQLPAFTDLHLLPAAQGLRLSGSPLLSQHHARTPSVI
ncbi:hypothetical protein FOCC_FOCC012518 [Frankliniella occidentalis]|nr:hypothetical protein FOCC_FOCC012518 [Frankliniella occidentalis]